MRSAETLALELLECSSYSSDEIGRDVWKLSRLAACVSETSVHRCACSIARFSSIAYSLTRRDCTPPCRRVFTCRHRVLARVRSASRNALAAAISLAENSLEEKDRRPRVYQALIARASRSPGLLPQDRTVKIISIFLRIYALPSAGNVIPREIGRRKTAAIAGPINACTGENNRAIIRQVYAAFMRAVTRT